MKAAFVSDARIIHPMDYEVRHIRQGEWPLLEDFLYEAIFVPEGFEGEIPRSVIYEAALQQGRTRKLLGMKPTPFT